MKKAILLGWILLCGYPLTAPKNCPQCNVPVEAPDPDLGSYSSQKACEAAGKKWDADALR
jgi:hypothetical protein